MSLSSKPLDDEWAALAAREALAVANTFQRPRFGAAAAAAYQHHNLQKSSSSRLSPTSSSSSPLAISNSSVRQQAGRGSEQEVSPTRRRQARSGEGDRTDVRSAVDARAVVQVTHSKKEEAGSSTVAGMGSGFGRGAMLRVPSKAFPTVEDAVFAAKDGDCIFLEPIVFTFKEPVLIARSIHIIGVDEVGTCAVLAMDGGLLKPPLPLLRISNARVHLKGLTIKYTHNEERATVDSVTQAFSMFVSDGGSVVLDEVSIQSSCGGIRGTAHGRPASSSANNHHALSSSNYTSGSNNDDCERGSTPALVDPERPRGTYVTATCCKFECDTTAVQVEGQAFIDRCTIAVGARGIAVQDGALAKIEGSGFVGGAIGVDVQKRGRAIVERNAFVDVAIGVNIFNGKIGIPQPSLVRGNEFRNPTETAVRTEGEGATADVCKNLIHGFTHRLACGLEVRGGRPELLSNVIRDCLGTSVALLGGSPLVEGNVLELGRVGICVRSSRPTIRLNEICLQQEAGVVVESSAIPYAYGMDPQAAVAAGRISAAPSVIPTSSSSPAEGPLVPELRTRATVGGGSHEGQQTIINPLSEADPHVEANNFHDNGCNLKVSSVTGTFLKNDFSLSQLDNVVLDGPVVVPIVLSGNLISGSREGCAVLAANGVEAHITDNMISGAKVACVMLKGSRFCEIKSNVLQESQTAFVAMERALGRFVTNEIESGMAVDINTDSQPTVTVVM